MRKIVERLFQNPAVEAIIHNQTGVGSLGLQEEALILSAAFLRSKHSMFVVKNNLYEAQNLYQRLVTLCEDDVYLYCVEESLQVEAIASSPELYAQKIETLTKLLESDKPVICVTHIAAVLRYLPTVERFKESILNLSLGYRISMDSLKTLLVQAGYKHVARVDQPLCFSFRGGVVDIFSVQNEHPVRIEFFDDEIDSIRMFDVASQRTIATMKSIEIVPATDFIYTDDEFAYMQEKILAKLAKDMKKADNALELEERIQLDLEYLQMHVQERYLYRYMNFLPQTNCLLDYMPNAQIILSNVEEIKAHVQFVMDETISYIQQLYQEHRQIVQITDSKLISFQKQPIQR